MRSAKCDKKRCALSVFVEARAEARICAVVPPKAFYPPPKVHSSVVELRLRPKAEVGNMPIHSFDAVVDSLFTQPRKTVRNNLAAVVGRDAVDGVLAGVNIEPQRRPGTLTLAEIQALAASIRRWFPVT